MKKNYEFTRDLDGAPVGSKARLTLDEAAPLLNSGAIVEAQDQGEGTTAGDATVTSATITASNAAATANAATTATDNAGERTATVEAGAPTASVTTTRRKRAGA